ncbi:MAG TPA: GxxExxY protein [Pyrinomonadaceae bacterium]|nr:GxxExxY protein [Pyrinomonadaceae bacterium]
MDTDKKKDEEGFFGVLFDPGSASSFGELNVITEQIIRASFTVSNTLGCGFLEKVYENALSIELRKAGLLVKQQEPIKVFYSGEEVGFYQADLVVDDRVLVELKSVREMNDVHRAQCINYLKATGLRICLLINFGNPKVEVKRIAL